MSKLKKIELKILGGIVSLFGVVAFIYGLVTGWAMLYHGRYDWMSAISLLLFLIGPVLLFFGNKLQGWDMAEKIPDNRDPFN